MGILYIKLVPFFAFIIGINEDHIVLKLYICYNAHIEHY
jgi:hypothetical protein